MRDFADAVLPTLTTTSLSHCTHLYSTGITISLQSLTPVDEPGNDGNTTVDVCVTVDSVPAGPFDRVGDIVVTFNTVPGTAGILLLTISTCGSYFYCKCTVATLNDLTTCFSIRINYAIPKTMVW